MDAPPSSESDDRGPSPRRKLTAEAGKVRISPQRTQRNAEGDRKESQNCHNGDCCKHTRLLSLVFTLRPLCVLCGAIILPGMDRFGAARDQLDGPGRRAGRGTGKCHCHRSCRRRSGGCAGRGSASRTRSGRCRAPCRLSADGDVRAARPPDLQDVLSELPRGRRQDARQSRPAAAAFAVAGGKHGSAVVPGDPAKSRLLQRMKSGEMPPSEKKVPIEQIAIIEKWVAAGAATLHDEPAGLPPGLGITAEERASWFYQPLKRPTPPAFASADRVRTPIDAFVLGEIAATGTAFNPDADRATLIRRAPFDLTGLPPTPQEIDDFLSDTSADAYEKLLDRLLASPALWRALGPALARRGRLCRQRRRRLRGHPASLRLALPRLRHPRPQCRQAAGPIHGRAARGRRPGTAALDQPHRPSRSTCWRRPAFCGWPPTAPASGGTPADANQVMADTIKIVSSCPAGR